MRLKDLQSGQQVPLWAWAIFASLAVTPWQPSWAVTPKGDWNKGDYKSCIGFRVGKTGRATPAVEKALEIERLAARFFIAGRLGVEPAKVQFTPKGRPIVLVGGDESTFVPDITKLPQVENTESFDVIVVGGGPSGLSASSYLTRKGADLKVLMLERESQVGGLAMGSEHYRFRAATGAAYAAGPDGKEEYKMYQELGLGNYKKRFEIPEPIDSFVYKGRLYNGVWHDEAISALPRSFELFRHTFHMLDKIFGDIEYNTTVFKGVVPGADIPLDQMTAKQFIDWMPEFIGRLDDPTSKAIYKRFKEDARINAANPMSDVYEIVNRYCRSALGALPDRLSGYAFWDFYASELVPRYAGQWGTGDFTQTILEGLKKRGRKFTFETSAPVAKIVQTAEGAVVYHVKNGVVTKTKAKKVVFSAQLNAAPKIIEGFTKDAPEHVDVINKLQYTHYLVHTVHTEGHPFRWSYDTWFGGANDAADEPSDLIMSRWMDPDVKGYRGYENFEKNPKDDYGIYAIYQPIGDATPFRGTGPKRLLEEADKSVDFVIEKLGPLAQQDGQQFRPILIETNRWPLSIHVVEPGHFSRVPVLYKPVKHVYLANNGMGKPEFEEALGQGKRAAQAIIDELKDKKPQ